MLKLQIKHDEELKQYVEQIAFLRQKLISSDFIPVSFNPGSHTGVMYQPTPVVDSYVPGNYARSPNFVPVQVSTAREEAIKKSKLDSTTNDGFNIQAQVARILEKVNKQ